MRRPHVAALISVFFTACMEVEARAFRDCADCPEMVLVPPGSIAMAEWDNVGTDSFGDRGWQPLVKIKRVFAVGKFEVTLAEWDACIAAGGCYGYRPNDRKRNSGHKPAVNISWLDAQAYVKWLSKKAGKRYRLLSEAEWEYVAWSGETATSVARLQEEPQMIDGESEAVHLVTSKANRFGVHGMHGNVWEWTEDCWNETYAGAPSDGSPWRSGSCNLRVLRDSEIYWDGQKTVRSAARDGINTSRRLDYIGFRVARGL